MMQLNINTKTINPCALGEILRELTFTSQGYGCYENFIVREEFVEISNYEGANLLDYDCAQEAIDSDIAEHARAYSNGTWNVAWYWDGDGSLVFWNDEFAIINEDCKKDYTWKSIKLIR